MTTIVPTQGKKKEELPRSGWSTEPFPSIDVTRLLETAPRLLVCSSSARKLQHTEKP